MEKQAPPPIYDESKSQSTSGSMPAIRNQYACLTLNMSDLLRCISFPDATIGLIRETINNSWPRGIQGERDYYGAHEFKLKGNPWYGQVAEAVPSRQLMCALLSALYHAGWQLVASTDVTKKSYDKDSLFFRSATIPSPCTFFAASFNEGDKLRLINAPPNVINAVKQILGGAIQREEWKVPNVAYQFKMHGYPWYANGSDTVTTRVLLLNILDALAAYGWELHATVDMSTGSGGSESRSAGQDTDSWFLKKFQQ
ncbi:hypothetical protein EXIGLDRAFT_718798 [Exidia glandulosa HHB12029]|uniref:Uncharacterized protein n=1 Tax=Exidia glandulosa HHB12029 TaxID=1314781 RepID=A0A165HIA9_EXIGL|nr:hypothetical protein EXIGLDRAFT_718798 [Exidia glandulosa HHB12029]